MAERVLTGGRFVPPNAECTMVAGSVQGLTREGVERGPRAVQPGYPAVLIPCFGLKNVLKFLECAFKYIGHEVEIDNSLFSILVVSPESSRAPD